ncbi:hypothetical protein HDU82_004922 [Entophlyctis luteolus]|nr:hypothetical protein HDU82_004922 [Entophlyctis luteolus]
MLSSYGHLNNVHYMRYFESGRMAYFEQVLSKFLTEDEARGFINAAAEKKIGAIVKSIALNYRKVVDYPDTGDFRVCATLLIAPTRDHVCIYAQ